jgi:hypothetical protein
MPRRVRAVAGCLAAVVPLTACSAAEGAPTPPIATPTAVRGQAPADAHESPLSTDRARQSLGPVVSGGSVAPYNYVPSVLLDGGQYRVWWCSQVPGGGVSGDDVLTSEAPALKGPFPDGAPVFGGSGGGFDAVHTCDPSVIRVDGTYYLYYTGAAGDAPYGNAIGVATSPDGLHWQRAAANPIVTPSKDVLRPGNTYGAGQPSVLHLDGWFYLMFTDTTGAAANDVGSGQFVLRSPDPTFATGTQALTPNGFVPVSGTNAKRSLSVADAFSADWMWVDALNAFAIAHEVERGTAISFWDKDFTTHPYADVVVAGKWNEGPGLVRRVDGHAPVSPDDPCQRVPVDLLRATRDGGGGPTDISSFGLDLTGVGGCRTPATAAGIAMPAPDRTVEMVVDGKLVRIERRSVAEQLALRVLDKPVPGVDSLPVAATIRAGAEVLHAPDRPYAFVAGGALWPAGPPAVEADSAHVTEVSDAEWDARPKGGDLSAFRGN